MTHSTAMVADVTAFRGRDFVRSDLAPREFMPGEFRRTVFGTLFVGVGSVAALGAMIVAMTAVAACIVGGLHEANPHSRLAFKRPFALGGQALTRLESEKDRAREIARDAANDVARNMARDMSKALEISAAVRALAPAASVNVVKLTVFKAPTQVAAAAQVVTQHVAAFSSMPLPARRPTPAPQMQAVRDQAARDQAARENVRLTSAYAP
jgi:hypothetical protein